MGSLDTARAHPAEKPLRKSNLFLLYNLLTVYKVLRLPTIQVPELLIRIVECYVYFILGALGVLNVTYSILGALGTLSVMYLILWMWFFYILDFLKHHVPTVGSFTVTGDTLPLPLGPKYSPFARRTASRNELGV